MSIITMCDKDTPGAYKSDSWSNQVGRDIYLHETYVGCVIYLGEHNGYHDSDFYAIVWDDENEKAKKVEYASTRGWSYPNYATFADATEEVLEKYAAWQKHQARLSHIRHKLSDRRKLQEDRMDTGLSVKLIRRLDFRLGHSSDHYEACIKLLRTRHNDRFRSEFRRNLAEQLYTWLEDVEPKYTSPFSRKQWMYI